MANVLNIGSISNSAIQQGSPHAQQIVQLTINRDGAREALHNFQAALDRTSVPEEIRAEMAPDIQTIRAQLGKATPSFSIVREAGASLRKIAETAAGELLKPGVAAAATALWSALGVG